MVACSSCIANWRKSTTAPSSAAPAKPAEEEKTLFDLPSEFTGASKLRKQGGAEWLRPDAQSQVAVLYDNGLQRIVPPRTGRTHVLRLVHELTRTADEAATAGRLDRADRYAELVLAQAPADLDCCLSLGRVAVPLELAGAAG